MAVSLLLSASLFGCSKYTGQISVSSSVTTTSSYEQITTTEQTSKTSSEVITSASESLTEIKDAVELDYDYNILNTVFGEGSISFPFTRDEYLKKDEESGAVSLLIPLRLSNLK